MKLLAQNHSFATARCSDFIDLTDDVLELVEQSGIANGVAVVFSPHTTGAIIINERERGFIADFHEMVGRLVPDEDEYRHDDTESRVENRDDTDHTVPNGHAHCRHALLGSASQSVPVIDGRLQLGRWQRVFFVECDRARDRRVLIQVLGE